VCAAAALGGRHHRGQVAHRGRVGQRHGVNDHAGGREREHRPAPAAAVEAGAGGGTGTVWGSAASAQQVQSLGGIERGEQRGEHGGIGEQQREAVHDLRPRHRRVRRPQDGGGGGCVLPPALPVRRRRGRAAAVHGAGLGEEQEGE